MKNTKAKRITALLMSLLLIAAMLTAVSVSASAATPDEATPSYYSIDVIEYIDDEKSNAPTLVSVSSDKVSADSGEEITVIVDEEATSESSLVFDYLYFEGEFEVVEGSLDEFITSHDTVVVLKPMSDIYIEANFYDPNADEFEDYDPDWYSELPSIDGPDISYDHDGSGTVDYKDKLMDIDGDGYFDIMDTDEGFILIKNVTLTAVPDGADFVRWDIDGDYELISGSLTDPVIVVRPKSIRLSATAVFADSPALAHKPAEKPEATPDQKLSPSGSAGSGSGSATSPKTRDMLPLFAVITLAAVFAAGFAVTKIKEK